MSDRPSMNSCTLAQVVVGEGYIPARGRTRCYADAGRDPCRGCELRATCHHTRMACKAFRYYVRGIRFSAEDRGADLALARDEPDADERPALMRFTTKQKKPRKARSDRGLKRGKRARRS